MTQLPSVPLREQNCAPSVMFQKRDEGSRGGGGGGERSYSVAQTVNPTSTLELSESQRIVSPTFMTTLLGPVVPLNS